VARAARRDDGARGAREASNRTASVSPRRAPS
jgi:hypothetical protein